MKKITKKIKTLVGLIGNQSRLSKATGIPQPNISSLIREERDITPGQISALVDFFEIPVEMLTDDTKEIAVKIDVMAKWIRTMKGGEISESLIKDLQEKRASKSACERLSPVQGTLTFLMDKPVGYQLTKSDLEMLDEAEDLLNKTTDLVFKHEHGEKPEAGTESIATHEELIRNLEATLAEVRRERDDWKAQAAKWESQASASNANAAAWQQQAQTAASAIPKEKSTSSPFTRVRQHELQQSAQTPLDLFCEYIYPYIGNRLSIGGMKKQIAEVRKLTEQAIESTDSPDMKNQIGAVANMFYDYAAKGGAAKENELSLKLDELVAIANNPPTAP